jgi:hypothetical protein
MLPSPLASNGRSYRTWRTIDGAIGRVQIMDSECLRRLDDVDSGGSVSGNGTTLHDVLSVGGAGEGREVNVFTGRSSLRRDSSGCQIVAPAVDPYPVRLKSRSEQVLSILANILIVIIIVAPYGLMLH